MVARMVLISSPGGGGRQYAKTNFFFFNYSKYTRKIKKKLKNSVITHFFIQGMIPGVKDLPASDLHDIVVIVKELLEG